MALRTWVFIIVVVLSNVAGNLALSWGMKHSVPALDASPLSYLRAIFDPFVLAGICLLILWMLSRMAFLSWADLSFVAPVTAVGYVLSAWTGAVFLGEQISARRWAGVLLIAAGALLVTRTAPRTTGEPVR